MNDIRISQPRLRTAADMEAIQARFGLRVAARLTERAEGMPAALGERLRFAREQALSHAQQARQAANTQVALRDGTLALAGYPDAKPPLWARVASVLPLLALIAGLMLIQEANRRAQVAEAAEIDAALLSDDLPPGAYSDPGFVEFLKSSRD
jgi:hypothetical protein